eukprot:9390619-Lingulodinium_polyedra.AAC.1
MEVGCSSRVRPGAAPAHSRLFTLRRSEALASLSGNMLEGVSRPWWMMARRSLSARTTLRNYTGPPSYPAMLSTRPVLRWVRPF